MVSLIQVMIFEILSTEESFLILGQMESCGKDLNTKCTCNSWFWSYTRYSVYTEHEKPEIIISLFTRFSLVSDHLCTMMSWFLTISATLLWTNRERSGLDIMTHDPGFRAPISKLRLYSGFWNQYTHKHIHSEPPDHNQDTRVHVNTLFVINGLVQFSLALQLTIILIIDLTVIFFIEFSVWPRFSVSKVTSSNVPKIFPLILYIKHK